MIRIPTHRSPTHPGEMLQEEFLMPLGFSPREVAEAISISEQEIDALIAGHAAMTPRLALRLAKVFSVSPDFWMNLQLRWDLFHVQQTEFNDLAGIKPLVLAT